MTINFNNNDDPLKGLFGSTEKPEQEPIEPTLEENPEPASVAFSQQQEEETNPLGAFFNFDTPQEEHPSQATPATYEPTPEPQLPTPPPTIESPPSPQFTTTPAREEPTPRPATPNPYNQPVRAEPAPVRVVVKDEEPEPQKNNRGKGKRTQKTSNYAGKRKQVLLYRILIVGVLIIVGLTGLQSMFFGGKGPTPAQLEQAILEQTGLNKFPVETGRQFAIDFANTYFTFDPSDSASLIARSQALKQYVSDVMMRTMEVEAVDPKTPSNNSDSEPPEGLFPGDNQPESHKKYISYGPYMVDYKVITPTYAVFTLKLSLNGSKEYLYYNVPVKYVADNLSITVAAPPTFSISVANMDPDSLNPSDYNLDISSPDHELALLLQSDIETFMKAWAQSDTTIINRYISDDATNNARIGLRETVTYEKLVALVIEPYNDNYPITEVERYAEITVQWKLSNNLLVSQKYHAVLVKNTADKWVVWDIKNFTETILP